MIQDLTNKEIMALREIRSFLMQWGKCPSVRELMRALKYSSPRSASVLIDQLVKKDFLSKKENGSFQLIKNIENNKIHAQTVDVPLVGTAACGLPIFAEENIEAMLSVSIKLARPPHRYFFLKAYGDSMDKVGINDDDFVLVRQQPTAQDGEIVVALIDDEATIKKIKYFSDYIKLEPRSSNPDNKPIIIERDFQIQGVVVKTL